MQIILAIGSMCAPLVCQSIIAKGIEWNHFYFGSLVLSAISSALAFYAFFPTTQEHEAEVTAALSGPATPSTISVEDKAPPTSEVDEANIAEVKQSLARTKNEHGGFLLFDASPWCTDVNYSPWTLYENGCRMGFLDFLLPIYWNVRIQSGDSLA